METKNAWAGFDARQLADLEAFSKDYRHFLNECKTERECVQEAVKTAKERGFVELTSRDQLQSGDRVYFNWMNKSFVLFVVGSKGLSAGMNILGSHIDSPRLDVKQNPLYEDSDLAYMDTHYYGGIKKYQWVARALALHGVIVKKSGETIAVKIGEDEEDPVLCISDLLPHMGKEQMKLEGSKVVGGEQLDVLIGGKPLEDTEKEAVKARALGLLKEKYDIDEEDFLSAELEVVPAEKARDLGFDRSMILSYGHDDRVCAYPSMRAVLDFEGTPERTICCILTDKEEIGDYGATGMSSQFFENLCAELVARCGSYSELTLRRMLANSRMLSSDVTAGYDPLYPAGFEKRTDAFLGRGLSFNKFTGSGGKGGANDANAEFIAFLRRVMDEANVAYQFTEMGKVDFGGGGTIARNCARYGMSVIDAGVPVISMHAPAEVISKADLYSAYLGYCAFIKQC